MAQTTGLGWLGRSPKKPEWPRYTGGRINKISCDGQCSGVDSTSIDTTQQSPYTPFLPSPIENYEQHLQDLRNQDPVQNVLPH
ncbi:hypothetical protein MFRU_006g03370 [Monilinia fructicola]|nr:hypothetical protein MFRU_006g03370 [Monilinia fructicola]